MSSAKKRSSVSVSDVREFTQSFSELLAQGLSLDSILVNAIGRTSNSRLSQVLTEVRKDVLAGYPLSVSLAKHDAVFDRNYVEMVRAGELTGSLDAKLIHFLSPPDLTGNSL